MGIHRLAHVTEIFGTVYTAVPFALDAICTEIAQGKGMQYGGQIF